MNTSVLSREAHVRIVGKISGLGTEVARTLMMNLMTMISTTMIAMMTTICEIP
jgi:hypothetical protein